MKVSQEVFYYDNQGTVHPATIVDVVGSGDSGFKILDLTYTADDETIKVVTSVPHVMDKTSDSSGYWTLTHDEPLPSGGFEVADEAQAEPTPELPAPEPTEDVEVPTPEQPEEVAQ